MKQSMQLIALLLVLLLCGATVPSPAQNKDTVLIKAGQLVDVRGGRVLANQAILIEGDRIKEVGDATTVASHAPSGVRIIDLSNSTVLPGLIDCHTHLTFDL